MKRIITIFVLASVLLVSISCVRVPKQIPEVTSKPNYFTLPMELRDILGWCVYNTGYLQKAMAEGKIYFLQSGMENRGFYSKDFGINNALRIPDSPDWGSSSLRLARRNQKLFLEFTIMGSGKYQIISVSKDKAPEFIYSSDYFLNVFDISPDESEMVFDKAETPTFHHIYRYQFKTGLLTQFSADSVGGLLPSYSPDGKWVAYVAQRKLRIKNTSTGVEKIIVNDSLLKELPMWSPDGNWIAYQATKGGEESYDIYKVRVATGKVYQLTTNPGLDANPSFTKNGKQILFISSDSTLQGTQSLARMDADGRNIKRDLTSPINIYYPMD